VARGGGDNAATLGSRSSSAAFVLAVVAPISERHRDPYLVVRQLLDALVDEAAGVGVLVWELRKEHGWKG